jgi:hypothetical protein
MVVAVGKGGVVRFATVTFRRTQGDGRYQGWDGITFQLPSLERGED